MAIYKRSFTVIVGCSLTLQLMGCITNPPKKDGDPKSPQIQATLKEPDPTNASELYSYAAALEQRGEEEKALGYYLQTTQVNPEHLKAQVALAQLYVKYSRTEEAKVAYENILRLDRQHPFILKYKDARLKYYGALNIAQNEEYEKALELLNKAPKGTPLDQELEDTAKKWKQLVDGNKSKKLLSDITQQASLLAYKGKYTDAIALIKSAPGAEADATVQAKIAQWKKAGTQNNAGITSQPSTPAVSEQIRYVSASKVYIRQSPYLYAQSLTHLKKGGRVELLMANAYQSDGYSWSKVRTSQGVVGWIASSLLSKTKNGQSGIKTPPLPNHPQQTQTTAKSYGQQYITGADVNIRRTPSIQGQLLSSLSRNTKVTLLSQGSVQSDGYQWKKIRLPDNQVGWVVNKFLGQKSQVSSPSVAQTKPQTKPQAKKVYRSISGTDVNVRKAPGVGQELVMQISSPSKVEILSKAIKKDNYYWIKIKNSQGKTGWMVTKFLKSSQAKASSIIRYIRGNDVNVREQPSTGSSVLSTLSEGTRVTLLSKPISKGGYKWVKVRLSNRKTGWVVSKYLGS